MIKISTLIYYIVLVIAGFTMCSFYNEREEKVGFRYWIIMACVIVARISGIF